MKKAGLIIGSLVAFIIIAVVGLEFYFTSDRLKSMTEPPVEEALQRNVEIGEMELSFLQTFPNVGVAVSDFMIPGLQQDTAASVRRLVVGVDVISLLGGQVNISELIIDQPFLDYRIYKDGSSAFDFAPADTTAETTPETDTSSTQMNLQVPEVVLNNATFVYNDESTGMHAAIRDLSGSIGLSYADIIETNLQLDAGGISVASDSMQYLSGLPLSINEISVIDLAEERVTLKEGGIAIKGLQIDLNGSVTGWSSEAPGVDLNFTTSSDQFGELLKLIPETYQDQIGEFDAGGALSFSGSVKGKIAENELPQLDAALDVQDAFLQHLDLGERISGITIQADITNEEISLKRVEASAGENNINANGAILKPLGNNPIARLTARAFIELSTIPKYYPIDTDTLDARGQLEASVTIDGSLNEPEQALKMAEFSLENGYLAYHKLGKPIESLEATGRVEGNKLHLDKINIESGTNNVNMSGVVKQFQSDNPLANLKANASLDLSTIPEYYPIDTDTLDMRGQLQASVTFDGDLNEPEKAIKNAEFSLENGYLAYHKLAKPVESLVASGRVEGTQLRLDKFDMKSGQNRVNVSGLVNRFQSENPDVDLSISSSFNLAEVPDYYSLEPYINEISGNILANLNVQGPTATPEDMDLAGSIILENANFAGDSLPTAPITEMNAEINLSKTKLSFKNTGLKIGPSDINFKGSIERYRELAAESIERPVEINGSLASKLFNYDAMFPAETEETEEELEPVPMEIPNIDLKIDIAADSIVYMGAGFYDARADLKVVQDRITINNMDTGIMSGRVQGKLVWNIPDPLSTTLSFTGRMDSVASGRFFRDFQMLGEDSKFDQYLSGDFNASVDYASEMDKYLEPVLESSTANGHFGMTESMLENHPAQLGLARFLQEDDLKRLKLDEWQADYTLEDGILELRNMNLKSGNLEMQLEGTQNLIKDELDYTATLWVPQKYAGNLSKVISFRGVKALTQEDGRVKIPLSITGSSENVKYRPDKEVINDLIKELLKDNVKDKIGNIFGDG